MKEDEGKLHVTKAIDGRASLLRFEGTLDESFAGQELGSTVGNGEVILGLAGIRRVTSFGIREWVSFLEEASRRCERILLVDCSPRFVAQLNMVSQLAGDGQVVSVMAPYFCDTCNASTDRRMDVREHVDEIQSLSPTPQPCEVCGGHFHFDDDPGRFFSFLENQGPVVLSAETTAFLARHLDYDVRASAPKVRIRKLVDGQHTVICLQGQLSDSLPVNEIKEGLEGLVSFDLYDVTRASPSGIQLLRNLIEGTLALVSTEKVLLSGVPTSCFELARTLATAQPKTIELQSVTLPYRCDRCATTSKKEIDLTSSSALSSGEAPPKQCVDCEGELACLAPLKTLLEFVGMATPPARSGYREIVEKARTGERSRVVHKPPRRWARWAVPAGVVVGGLVALIIIAFFPSPPEPVVSRPRYREASLLSPPSWRDKTVYRQGKQIFVVGVSTLCADKATAFAESAHAGLDRLLMYLLRGIEEKGWQEVVGKVSASAREKLLAELKKTHKKDRKRREPLARRVRLRRSRVWRSFAETSREIVPPVVQGNYWESFRDGDELFYQVWSQTKVADADLEKAKRYYTERHEVLGATVVTFFPLLCWQTLADRGVVIVDIDVEGSLYKAGLRRADIVTRIDKQAIGDAIGFRQSLERAYATARKKGGTIVLEVVRVDGKRKTLSLDIPKRRLPRRSGRGSQQTLPPANIWSDDPSQ